MTDQVEEVIIIAVIPLFCISVVIALLYLAFRLRVRNIKSQMDGLTMIEATPPEPSFDVDQLKIMNLVGQGRYCSVYKGVLNEREVAVKIFAGASRQCYMNELDIYGLAYIEHDNVLKFIGASERMGEDGWLEFLMVVELMPFGSLMEYLRHHTYDWHSMCRLAQTMAAGLAHLHQSVNKGGSSRPAVVHRDLNSRNILVKSDQVCVLGDFGFSMKVAGAQVVRDGDGDPSTITDVGTVRYMSPEVLDGAVNLRDCESALKQVDIYAMGLCLWEIATRCKDLFPSGDIGDYKMPYQDDVGSHPSFEEMQILVSRDRKRPAFPDAWKENNQALRSLKETMEDCWDHDAEARLTALCVEERIIELMVLWDKHKTVSPTINPTSQGLTLPNYSETDSHVTIMRDGTELSSRVDIPTNLQVTARPPSCMEAMNAAEIANGEFPRYPSRNSGGPIEKNERQRLLSPDTISTSLSNQSDLNLIDLALGPTVDPKNIHNSDESIERFTTDLKYGRPHSISGETSTSEGYGMSEPTTSPSQPLVMHEMRPSLARDQMTDNLGGRMKQQNSLNRPTSLPMWGHLTVNEARARATNIYSSLADNLGSHQKPRNPAKLDTNKHRQQARAAAAAAAAAAPQPAPQPTHPESQMERSTSQNSIGSIGSYHSSSGDSDCSSGSDHSRRPKTLPLPTNGHGSKKRLVAVYMPDVGPSAKVQTGIAKMDSVHPQCHAVKMATNGNNSKAKPDSCRSVDMNGVHACENEHSNIRGKLNKSVSDSIGASQSDDRMSEDSQSEQSGSVETSLLRAEEPLETKKGRRRGTPYRLGSGKLSVHKGDKQSGTTGKPTHAVCDEHNMNNNAQSMGTNTAETMQNGHVDRLENGSQENGVLPQDNDTTAGIENTKPVANNMYTLDSEENQTWNSSQEGAPAPPQGSFQVSCV
ncbi:uncharacterized protein [Amphiura filiformis]